MKESGRKILQSRKEDIIEEIRTYLYVAKKILRLKKEGLMGDIRDLPEKGEPI